MCVVNEKGMVMNKLLLFSTRAQAYMREPVSCELHMKVYCSTLIRFKDSQCIWQ